MLMRKVVIMVMFAALVTACGKKQAEPVNEPVVTTAKAVERIPREPVRMQGYTSRTAVKWLGSDYTVEVVRSADDGLPMVEDDGGQQFFDNAISLRILRSDGSVAIKKTFTKSSFTSYLPKEYVKGGVMEGFVLDKVEPSSLVFAASVCLPRTDEYIPLHVSISRMGDVSVSRDEHLEFAD